MGRGFREEGRRRGGRGNCSWAVNKLIKNIKTKIRMKREKRRVKKSIMMLSFWDLNT